MTDIQKQPIPEEVGGGPSVAPADPPPYQTGPDQMQPPPPYPYGSTVYSTYPPVAAAYGPDPTPPVYPAYPPYPPGQGGHVADNLPPEGNMAYTGTSTHCVVTLQLLVTFSVVCVFTFSETVKTAVQSNIWVYISSYIIFMVVAMCLSVCSSFSRLHPWNLISLQLVTLSLSYMVGTVASFHNTTSVVIAMGATLVISFTIIIFSAQTRVDFTICNGIIIILAVDLLMFGFFSIFYYSSMLQILYGCLGALLYSLFLAVDCQLVMGREKYSLNPEEYVFGALIIYLDIIMIFLYILMILGGSSNN
uniref:Si:ch211-284o19.8 n=1 Tax=Astyanax mexicanus TaxID=7994 RepID=A0A3B1IUT1_ASTMX